LKGFFVKRFVTRSIATVAILATLSFGAPAIAMAGTATTATTTTTIVITTMKQYRAAERVYLAALKVINETFILAVSTAKSNYAAALSVATNSSARISARSTYHSAIAVATLARSNSLSILGKPPVKPKVKSLTAVA
jgi:hypothetical protein